MSTYTCAENEAYTSRLKNGVLIELRKSNLRCELAGIDLHTPDTVNSPLSPPNVFPIGSVEPKYFKAVASVITTCLSFERAVRLSPFTISRSKNSKNELSASMNQSSSNDFISD